MKWITLVGMALILSGCGYYRTTEVVEYRQVMVAPVVQPAYCGPCGYAYCDPCGGSLDVTTTAIDFY